MNGHLEVVKYLYEECHANVEAKDNDGYTPIICASINGYLEIVKYLVEECHATITDEAISKADNDEIRRYLQSKR
jgi:ankyrin repeat protein